MILQSWYIKWAIPEFSFSFLPVLTGFWRVDNSLHPGCQLGPAEESVMLMLEKLSVERCFATGNSRENTTWRAELQSVWMENCLIWVEKLNVIYSEQWFPNTELFLFLFTEEYE